MAVRYAPVPQLDQDVIILDTIRSPNYNFNTGIPNSVPSSHAPSVAPSYNPSVSSSPNFPPQSFHTHSSPGTPRATPSTSGATLWGVAPSSISLNSLDAPTEICAASDALNTIRMLQTRVERLEESLGRLLIEKEAWAQSGDANERQNCCVTFTDASGDLERSIAAKGHNCCVTFRGKKSERSEETKRQIGVIVVLLIIAMMVIGITAVTKGGCHGKECGVEAENH